MFPTHEMIEAARNAAKAELYPSEFAMRAALTAALALLPGEPVGYVVEELAPPRLSFFKTKPSISSEDMSEYEITIDPVYAAPAPLPVAVKAATHRHKKRGSEYTLIGIGKMQAENWIDMHKSMFADSVDLREVAIYRSVDDRSLWVRPREEFEDGRFEAIRSALSSPVGGMEEQASVIEQCALVCDSVGWAPIEGITHGVWDRAYRQAARDLAARIRKISPTPGSDIAALREYALEATKVITGLAGGGSENFSGQIGDMFKADLEFCAKKIRDRHETIHNLLVKAKTGCAALREEIERLRSLLTRSQRSIDEAAISWSSPDKPGLWPSRASVLLDEIRSALQHVAKGEQG